MATSTAIIAITINNSIKVNPLSFRFIVLFAFPPRIVRYPMPARRDAVPEQQPAPLFRAQLLHFLRLLFRMLRRRFVL